ncbi:MAG: CRISPR-associated helicase Cas3', partial [Planctomycetes bacterium]|nr:CRISPR-associated helicase Cas3' [Planctomycetota bacterium]
AELAKEFASRFGAGEWGYLAGLWHDLGKYSNEFQKKLFDANGIECHLETKPGKVIHSQAGGHLAQKTFPKGFDLVFCWLIMGHHAGLADFSSADSGAKALEPKMRHPEESDKILGNVPESTRNQQLPPPPTLLRNGADLAFFIRMLFSCVVDADFLDTEAFMDDKRKTLRNVRYPSLEELLSRFDEYMESLCATAEPTEVNKIRAEVLQDCRTAAEREPGVFSLTVPTGGGKTLSSLAFALRHAVKWQKRRVIYVIPYTSIIEQTAAVFRKIPGFESTVLEHHCNVFDDDETKETVRSRLATENWDAPLIVTTSVQFFESLYACRTSRCRKLHNIADSVVVFDEAQCFPPGYLRPVVFAVRELQRHFSVSAVLCTATQPVLTRTESFDFQFREGFDHVHEIIAEPARLFDRLRRVRVERLHDLKPISLETLAEAVWFESCAVLCIVNSKAAARELARLLPEGNTVHLSTNMCAEHRLRVLKSISNRLTDREPLIVVSTSLVEAGVDLDFPVVYRALAGLDSIAQAAGRCNREGRLAAGRTVVFLPGKQPQYVRSAASQARPFLEPDRLPLVLTPGTFTDYFTARFFLLGSDRLDEKKILEKLSGRLENFAFRSAAERFHLIDDRGQRILIVPVGEAPQLVAQLLCSDGRILFRKLQRYTVSLPEYLLRKLADGKHAHELPGYPGIWYLDNKALYSDRFGFVPPDGTEGYDIDPMIV